MNRIYTGRRDFLKQRADCAVAMMAECLKAQCLCGPRTIVEDAVLPVAQGEEAPKNHIKFPFAAMIHDHIYGIIGAVTPRGEL